MIRDITHTFASLEATDYLTRYRDVERFSACCRACDRYGRMWGCPPFEEDPVVQLAGCRSVRLVGTTVGLTDEVRHRPTTPAEQFDLSYRILREVRRTLDVQLLDAERRRPGSRAFFAGNCSLCHPERCARADGLLCRMPDRARPSLEAWGFDLVRTASELLGLTMCWSDNLVLPPYFTCISALFTHDEPDPSPLW